MRALRVLAIIILTSHIGYQSAKMSLAESSKASLSSPMHQFGLQAEFADTIVSSHTVTTDNLPPLTESYSPSTRRSWLGWIQSLIRGQLECAVSAVGLLGMLVNMFSPFVNSRFSNKPNQANILAALYEMYLSGFESLFEHVYSWLGEIALYVFSIIGFTALFSILLQEVSSSSTPHAVEL
mmetsp:Transcript_15293/g.20953  ORF Transcript_15293/g.20953 Transcript_15293/m.20953 type:complete len:181 (-) Transcript_15293:66-608(-)